MIELKKNLKKFLRKGYFMIEKNILIENLDQKILHRTLPEVMQDQRYLIRLQAMKMYGGDGGLPPRVLTSEYHSLWSDKVDQKKRLLKSISDLLVRKISYKEVLSTTSLRREVMLSFSKFVVRKRSCEKVYRRCSQEKMRLECFRRHFIRRKLLFVTPNVSRNMSHWMASLFIVSHNEDGNEIIHEAFVIVSSHSDNYLTYEFANTKQ